jgi:protein-ribulosamine 3-kinase
MNPQTRAAIAQAIGRATGSESPIASEHPAAGGCINDAREIRLRDGREFFIKMNAADLPGLFECETHGLRALREVGALAIPQPIVCGGGEASIPSFIVMELVRQGPQGSRLQEKLGRGLANLHRRSQHDRFGFDHDNYLGSTPQPNGWKDDWVAFWREHRLGFQFNLARRNGLTDRIFDGLADSLLQKLEYYLTHPREPACLLHGDLWGGNVLSNANGEPVLIDPAAYYGRREADLAMTMLFGGFNARFYAAYEEEWPLEPDSTVRLDLYKLYHLLNHLNLFGHGYRSGCMDIMRRYA